MTGLTFIRHKEGSALGWERITVRDRVLFRTTEGHAIVNNTEIPATYYEYDLHCICYDDVGTRTYHTIREDELAEEIAYDLYVLDQKGDR